MNEEQCDEDEDNSLGRQKISKKLLLENRKKKVYSIL